MRLAHHPEAVDHHESPWVLENLPEDAAG